jgi:hypothetical protein
LIKLEKEKIKKERRRKKEFEGQIVGRKVGSLKHLLLCAKAHFCP